MKGIGFCSCSGMRVNGFLLVAASVVFSVMVLLVPQRVYAESSQSASGPSVWVVPVFLPDIAAIPELNSDKWIDLADLAASDRPESSYEGFRLPRINAVYTWHKSVIEGLIANCSVILIDYREATVADVSALRVDGVIAVGVCGPQARIVTKAALEAGGNPALVSADLMEFVAMAKGAYTH